MPNWIKNFAPDVTATMARFPLAIIFSFISTLLFIGLTNDVLPMGGDEFWVRIAVGLSFGAIFAVAGVLYGESRTSSGIIFLTLAYVMPFIVAALLQVQSNQWIVVPMLAPIGLLWLSVSAFTHIGKGAERAQIQDRFWWLNHRAITTAVIAGVGFGLIALGLVAVERSMAVLFGIKSSRLFYEMLLPFTGLFLTPVYWLSTIPKLEDFSQKEISEPDFLSRAIGFLGQFILTPFLFIYALILLAYGAQIVLSGELPQGMLSWMVLGFTIVGAANWLVLYPDFMHKRPLVKYFRQYWFWLTLIPAALYIVAVWVRIDAYGLTEERVGLIAAGLWVSILTLTFLTKKFADIRLIPAIALVVIAFFSIGRWNFVNLPQLDQAMRLDVAIHNATPINQTAGGPYSWTDETAAVARGAIAYLSRVGEKEAKLFEVLGRHNVPVAERLNTAQLFEYLGIVEQDRSEKRELTIPADFISDVTSTPFYYSQVLFYRNAWHEVFNLRFQLKNHTLLVKDASETEQGLRFADWLEKQSTDTITSPDLDFSYAGNNYRLVIETVRLVREDQNSDIWFPTVIEGVLFGSSLTDDNRLPN